MVGDEELRLRRLLDIQVEMAGSSRIDDSGIRGRGHSWIGDFLAPGFAFRYLRLDEIT